MNNLENKDRRYFGKSISSFSIIIVFICLIILGLFSVPQLPLKLNPSKKQPVVNISFSMWGQSARVIETEVTSKLEAMLGRIRGIKGINSYSGNGSGSITLNLTDHIDPEMVRFEVSTIVRQAWPSLPDGVSYPSIYMSGTTDEASSPFLHYTVNAPLSPTHIQEYVENNIKTRFSGMKGIDRIDVTGASQMIYKLEYDYAQLQKLNVSLEDLKSGIQRYLTKEFLGIGKVNDGGKEQWIRIALIPEKINPTFEPSTIQIKNSTGTILYLDQLVKTTFLEEEASSYFRINGLNSIYISFTAKDDVNQLILGKEVKALLAEIQKSMETGYELHLIYDAGEYIQTEMQKIYFQSGLTILILLCFIFITYRNLKYSLLIVLSLIANILIAAIFYLIFKLELQLYSLAGLTISLTLIIDNTIIMSDQIIQRGNQKTFLAILTATTTSIGALAIIFFMDENIRLNLEDLAWVIIINLAISLFIALFLVPALIEKLHITQKRHKSISLSRTKIFSWLPRLRKGRANVYINQAYAMVIRFMYGKRKWFFILLILSFGLPVFLLPEQLEKDKGNDPFAVAEKVDSVFLRKLYNNTLGSAFYKETIKPISDVALGGTSRLFVQKVRDGSYFSGERSETALNITASMPNGTTRLQMDNLISKMEQYLKQYPQVRQFETNIENGQRASIRVLFVKKHQRSSFPHELKAKLIGKALELGGGSWSVYGLGDGFNNDVKEQAGSSRIKLFGYNYDELSALSKAMQDSLLKHRRIKEVTIDSKFSWFKNDYMEFVFDLNKERLAQENILPINLFQALSPIYERSSHVGNWVTASKTEPIRLFSQQANERDVWNTENYPLHGDNKDIKLSEIATIEKGRASQDIAKENQQYRLCLQYEYIGSYQQAVKVQEQAIKSFNKTAPLGYKAESESYRYWWGDENSSQYWLLLLVIAIIFFTSSILFNSLKQPFIIIFIIPISFIGLFLTFYLFDLNFDQGGFAAFILLAGISVNANIYVLDEYNNIRSSRRISPLKAYIKAINAKIRPIFLTVISTVLGFLPFMIGEHREAFWFPLAAGTIGGLILSLIALIVFLPLFMGVGKTTKSNKYSL